jgi:hypothetical protein
MYRKFDFKRMFSYFGNVLIYFNSVGTSATPQARKLVRVAARLNHFIRRFLFSFNPHPLERGQNLP